MENKFELIDHDKTKIIGDVGRTIISNEFGKRLENVLCPFCKQTTEAYTWSLSGSGKKCAHCKNTLLGAWSAVMRCKSEAEAEKIIGELNGK